MGHRRQEIQHRRDTEGILTKIVRRLLFAHHAGQMVYSVRWKIFAKDSEGPFLCCQLPLQREEIGIVRVSATTAFIDAVHDGI